MEAGYKIETLEKQVNKEKEGEDREKGRLEEELAKERELRVQQVSLLEGEL